MLMTASTEQQLNIIRTFAYKCCTKYQNSVMQYACCRPMLLHMLITSL